MQDIENMIKAENFLAKEIGDLLRENIKLAPAPIEGYIIHGAIDKIRDMLITVHHNASSATIEACAKQWGLMTSEGKWVGGNMPYPPIPEINIIKKV